MIKTSENPAPVFVALLEIQKEIEPLVKDRQNTHTNSRYVTLDALRDYLRPLLTRHGLVVMQTVGATHHHPQTGIVVALTVDTRFVHADSGEWTQNSATVAVAQELRKDGTIPPTTSQVTGGAITYASRYALGAALSISTEEDDDGNGGSRPKTQQRERAQRAPRTVRALNEQRITNYGDVSFPKIKGFEEFEGKTLKDVPDGKIGEALAIASGFPGKNAKAIAKVFEDFLEAKRFAHVE